MKKNSTSTICYNIVHLPCIKETHSSRSASESLTANSHDTSESHFDVQSYSEQEAITRPWFGSSHAVIVSGGDGRSPSQPQPTTAQTNYRTGRSCIHCGHCNSTCSVFYQLLIHEKAITTKLLQSQVKEEWCSMMFCSAAVETCHKLLPCSV